LGGHRDKIVAILWVNLLPSLELNITLCGKEFRAMQVIQSQHGHTAKIFQFPVSQSARTRALRQLEIEAQGICDAADSGAWYHQAELQAQQQDEQQH
jgi:hypothetical protein